MNYYNSAILVNLKETMKKIVCYLCIVFLFNTTANLHTFTIDRVILSSNENPMYLHFWPLVAQAWQQIIGIKPTLILISEDHLDVDESLGDVIRLKPIQGVSTTTYAQAVRLLAPIYFPDEICIISDIDMVPLSKEYFVESVRDIPDDKFVVYRNLGYGRDSLRFPMCYNAGKGYLFGSIFNVHSIKDIPITIKKWSQMKWGWETDEVALYTHVRKWDKFKTNCVFLNHTAMTSQRIDRTDWKYDKTKLKNNYYIDAHLVRPLNKYYDQIKELAHDLGLFMNPLT